MSMKSKMNILQCSIKYKHNEIHILPSEMSQSLTLNKNPT